MTTLVPLCLGWLSNDASLMVPDETGPMRIRYLRRMLTARVTPHFAIDLAGQLASYDTLERHQTQGARLIFSHDIDEWDVVPDGLRRPASAA